MIKHNIYKQPPSIVNSKSYLKLSSLPFPLYKQKAQAYFVFLFYWTSSKVLCISSKLEGYKIKCYTQEAPSNINQINKEMENGETKEEGGSSNIRKRVDINSTAVNTTKKTSSYQHADTIFKANT